MPKYTPEREKIEAEKVSKSFLDKGSGAAVARERRTSRQNENKKLRREPYRDYIQQKLCSYSHQKRWLQEMLDGAYESEKSISATILVQKDGTVVKADDHGGIMVPDRHARRGVNEVAVAARRRDRPMDITGDDAAELAD